VPTAAAPRATAPNPYSDVFDGWAIADHQDDEDGADDLACPRGADWDWALRTVCLSLSFDGVAGWGLEGPAWAWAWAWAWEGWVEDVEEDPHLPKPKPTAMGERTARFEATVRAVS
jgi:hypothetical protein